ncbi:hypothetical protein ACFLTH_01115 [Bacteroidota bacterium]
MKNLILFLCQKQYLALIIFLIYANSQIAQTEIDTASTHTFWLNLGGGTGRFERAYSVNFSYQYKNYILSLRHADTSEGPFFGGEALWDTAVLFGMAATPAKTFYSLAAGISKVSGNVGVKSIEDVIGVAFEAQLFVRPVTFAGIGIYIFANINSEESFGGATLCLQLGLLR